MYGPDEYFWTACCIVDVYFQSEESVADYKNRGEDAPTGGARPVKLPYWDPREYFLTALSRRIQQATTEWKNIIAELERDLKVYVWTPFSTSRCKADK